MQNIKYFENFKRYILDPITDTKSSLLFQWKTLVIYYTTWISLDNKELVHWYQPYQV